VNIYGLVLPEIKKTLHITDAQAGYIGSIFLLGYTIGTIGFGFAADRWGRKATLGASILLYGVTTALAGLTTNIAAFTGLRFLTGVGGAGELAVGAPYTAEVWPAKTRAIGVGGVIFSLFSLGYVLAAGVALVLVPHFGWQSASVVAIVR
jgi:MFS transporter, putative metabolite:H+ symporter